MEYFRELVLPSLVTDVQAIFWEYLFPHGIWNRNQTLKNLGISYDNPDNKQILLILNKYPFLHNHMLIFTLPPKFTTHIHMDGLGDKNRPRNYSCNIPIEGCNNNCITEFFDADQSKFLADVSGTTRWHNPIEPTEKVAEYILINNPILTNTQFPHRVNNSNNLDKRISVSWTVKNDWTWDQITNYIAENY